MLKDAKERQEEVLAIIVRHYAETAEPVGSRYVSRQLGLSSATIRNVMADLEEMGFIMHPHTSAGRVPTDKGYRYYIDSLMRVKGANDALTRSIKDQYGGAMRSWEDVLERTSNLLSSLTHYVGLTVLAENEKLYLNGASHIIEQPEFRDLKKLYTILRFLEAKKEMIELINRDFPEETLTIHIGKENKNTHLADCSIVARGYKVKGKLTGKVGIIGPKRMAYEKVIPTIEILADTLTDILSDLEV